MLEKDKTYLITTDDGKMFYCSVERVGADQQSRWIFRSTDYDHVGPAWFPLAHVRELQQLVDEWWSIKKRLAL